MSSVRIMRRARSRSGGSGENDDEDVVCRSDQIIAIGAPSSDSPGVFNVTSSQRAVRAVF